MQCGHAPGAPGPAYGSTRRWQWPPWSPNSPLTKCRRLMGDTTYCAIWGFAAQYFAMLGTTTDFINGLIGGPARRGAAIKELAQRRAGGHCGLTGASEAQQCGRDLKRDV